LRVHAEEVGTVAKHVLFSSPQFKAFWDATGGLWQSGALSGKPGGFFFSTATQNGGQETTALTGVIF
jgi:multimeric flavodoxin WrbA